MISFCISTNSGLISHANRERYLRRLLASISTLNIPRTKYKVLVAGAVPSHIEADLVLPMAIEAKNGEICKLRNALISNSTTELIACCDDDILFADGYFHHIEHFIDAEWDILCTKLLNPNGSRYWDWAAHYPDKGQTLLPYDSTDSHVYATGGHAIYRKSIFKHFMWDESIRHGGNEEFQFAEKARTHGCRYAILPKATVFLQYHHCDAQSVIEGKEQTKIGDFCSEYQSNLAAALRILNQENRTTFRPLWDRIGYKVRPCTEPTKSTISVVTCCYKYLQRFRAFVQGFLNQNAHLNDLEVCVANPDSPDGLSDYICMLNKEFSSSGPRFLDVKIERGLRSNRGAMIQKAFEASSGQLILSMDCDIIVPQDFLERIFSAQQSHPNSVIGVYRNFLTEATTAKILSGMIDPISSFTQLAGSEDEIEIQGFRGVLGYCQILSRDAWTMVGGYPKEFNEIAKSDVAFVERLAKAGCSSVFLKELVVLHLHHSRNWLGVDSFL